MRKNTITLMLAAVGACVPQSGLMAAEADVFTYYASQNFQRDDNIFKLPSSSPSRNSGADTISNTRIGVKADRPVSRQRFVGEASLTEARYNRFSELDYTGTAARASWLWMVGSRWRGDLSGDYSRRLTEFGDFLGDTVRNINTVRRASLSAEYEIHPEWRLTAGASRARSTNDAAQRASSDSDTTTRDFGVAFVPLTGNRIGVRLRRSDGEYPNAQVLQSGGTLNNDYEQTDYELYGEWGLTGNSRLDGRVSKTRRRHEQAADRDFNGQTWLLNYALTLTGRSAVSTSLRREIGATNDLTASYVVTEGLSIVPSWQATSKIGVQGRLDWRKRSYSGDPTTTGREDRILTFGASGTYQLLRNVQLALGGQRERRSSSIADFAYRSTLYYVSGQISY